MPSARGADGELPAWLRQAMARAADCGIDPRRVLLALGIPLAPDPEAGDGDRNAVRRRA